MAKNKEDLKWHTEKRKVSSLIPTEGNPRMLTKKQAEDLEASLRKFNLVDIPAINTDNRIISGHQRMTILKALGRGNEEIDVRVPNRKLTDRICYGMEIDPKYTDVIIKRWEDFTGLKANKVS